MSGKNPLRVKPKEMNACPKGDCSPWADGDVTGNRSVEALAILAVPALWLYESHPWVSGGEPKKSLDFIPGTQEAHKKKAQKLPG